MTEEDEHTGPGDNAGPPGYKGRGLRLGQLAALLGLTGFAVSQPLLAVAGEDTTLFTYAGVGGRGLIVFALAVAFVPPLVLWAAVVLIGLADRRAGDATFGIFAATLAAATAIQWAKTIVGIDQGWALGLIGLTVAAGFGLLLARIPAVSLWTRYTAVLPVLAVALLVVASPASDLLTSRSDAPTRGSSGSGEQSLPSVVFLMLDEFPLETLLDEDGTIDSFRFPNFAALAGESTWYKDNTVQANGTLQSIPSILTGRTPTGGTARWTSHPNSLFRLLAPTHDLNVVETITDLCGFTTCGAGTVDLQRGGLRSVFSQMSDVWRGRVSLGPLPETDLEEFAGAAQPLDPEEANERGGNDPQNDDDEVDGPAAVANFVESLDGDGPPSLNYLHLMLPHQPWMRYPDGRVHHGWSRVELTWDDIRFDEWTLALLNQVHIFQAMYTDRLVGQMIEDMRASGVYDDALVVVTADHGVGFNPANTENLRLSNLETLHSLAYVPLFVKSPGQVEGRVDDSNLMGMDLLPTLADELGVQIPWDVDGFAASSPEVEARGSKKTFHDFGLDFGRSGFTIIEFDSTEHTPSADDRPIGPAQDGEHSLAPLAQLINAEQWLGVALEDLNPAPSGLKASLRRVEGLQDEAVQTPGRLIGEMDPSKAGSKVLLVADGVVQSIAPVEADGRFTFLVPPEIQPSSDIEISVALVSGDDRVSLLDT